MNPDPTMFILVFSYSDLAVFYLLGKEGKCNLRSCVRGIVWRICRALSSLLLSQTSSAVATNKSRLVGMAAW